MCLQNAISDLDRWNWDGERILPETILPSSRPAVGHRKQYLLDVREYLATSQNAVLRKTISHDIRTLVGQLYGKKTEENWRLFCSRDPGSFDFRARMVRAFVSQEIAYGKLDPRNPWQFPEETLVLRSGLCEDRAFLIASLMLAAGISSFNVRVALGELRLTQNGKVSKHDHMWVMYKNEEGHWLLIEPALTRKRARPIRNPAKHGSLSAQYFPKFLLNDSHLWQVSSKDQHLKTLHPLEKRWSRIHPRFAGEVHQSILTTALWDYLSSHHRLDILDDLNTNYFGSFLGNTVDRFDRGSYDPFQHFDNGYIDEGWQFVSEQLAVFKSNSNNIFHFASAAHAIADFYAHSSYLHFAKVDPATKSARPYTDHPAFVSGPDYTQGDFDLTSSKFTVNKKYWTSRSDPKIAAYARDLTQNLRVISGRYGQPGSGFIGALTGDLGPGGLSHQGPEIITTFPKDLIKKDKNFALRGALPHHNEIAVDDFPEKMSDNDYKIQKLYDRATYAQQFTYRFNTACRHILEAFTNNWSS